MGMMVEYTPGQADKFEETPEPGDKIKYNGKDRIVVGVDIINKSCLRLKIVGKREIKHIDDPMHGSVEWEKLPERFLDTGPEENFINQGSFK